LIDKQVSIFREKTADISPKPPLCLGFITYSSYPDGQMRKVLEKHRPEIVQFCAPSVMAHDGEGNGPSNVEVARRLGAKYIFAQVGNLQDAKDAFAAGCDVILTQGREAGGHGLRSEVGAGTLPLAAAVLRLRETSAHKPLVLAAGGICDGRGLAAMLTLGCDGAVMGTRLYVTKESMGPEANKAALVKADIDDVIRTPVFDQLQNTYLDTPWPYPFDSVGALHNGTSRRWHDDLKELQKNLKEEAAAYKAGLADPAIGAVLSGEGVGEIRAVEEAAAVLARVEREAAEVLRASQRLLA